MMKGCWATTSSDERHYLTFDKLNGAYVDPEANVRRRTPGAYDTYPVGYCRTLEETRFEKGKSGNLKGRPRKHRSLREGLEDELARHVDIREGGRTRKITKRRAMTISMDNKAAMGHPKACAFVANLMTKDGVVGAEHLALGGPLTENDAEIIADFLERAVAGKDAIGDSQTAGAAEASADMSSAPGGSADAIRSKPGRCGPPQRPV